MRGSPCPRAAGCGVLGGACSLLLEKQVRRVFSLLEGVGCCGRGTEGQWALERAPLGLGIEVEVRRAQGTRPGYPWVGLLIGFVPAVGNCGKRVPVAGGAGAVLLHGQLQESLDQGAHLPVPQLPQGLALPAPAVGDPSRVPVSTCWVGTGLSVGFGLLICGQLLALACLWAQPVEAVLCQVGFVTLGSCLLACCST